jgi:DNA helicase-2/ATP-dependent DNA helicase PcrA
MYGGSSEYGLASRFLTEIPAHLTTGSSVARDTHDDYRRLTAWDYTPGRSPVNAPLGVTRQQASPQRVGRFHSGQRVRHPKFGDGIVIISKVRGDDEEVDISFEKSGVKRLSANIANLEILPDKN